MEHGHANSPVPSGRFDFARLAASPSVGVRPAFK
jgi:hypothetical protein